MCCNIQSRRGPTLVKTVGLETLSHLFTLGIIPVIYIIPILSKKYLFSFKINYLFLHISVAKHICKKIYIFSCNNNNRKMYIITKIYKLKFEFEQNIFFLNLSAHIL